MASQIAREIGQITEDKVNSIISLNWEWKERKPHSYKIRYA
jgi:hypothetical protein